MGGWVRLVGGGIWIDWVDGLSRVVWAEWLGWVGLEHWRKEEGGRGGGS